MWKADVSVLPPPWTDLQGRLRAERMTASRSGPLIITSSSTGLGFTGEDGVMSTGRIADGHAYADGDADVSMTARRYVEQ